ncbi:hypothetical protein LOTGIDRAFT_155097 [Lottia gigantea]|uniref:OTU domain-containing protein n=1 Tax=Lottia gigantea TaxID=225164 RepID=V4B9J4_LOTGI|nr:hypothetical protein LOTGIDRAFT_155097 [Lottia gigantea]ESO85609.1 hypothetical protein LOTGIDRAFT_155097 [Lottia gigantea]
MGRPKKVKAARSTNFSKKKVTTYDLDNQNITEEEFISKLYSDSIEIPNEKLPNEKPTEITSIQGDGNCLFRSISFVLSLSEKSHRKVRRAIMNHIESKADLFTPLLREQYKSISDYIKRSRMRMQGTWGTEFEILAACDLLQTDIYIFTNNKWLKYPVLQINNSYTPEAIYLHHRDENHYEVVENVERSEPIIVIDDNVDTQLSGKRKHFKKKRGSRWKPNKKRTIYFQDYNLVKKELNSGQKVRLNFKLAFRTKKETNSLNKRRRKQYQISYIKAHLKRKYTNQLKSILHTQYETILKPKLEDKYQNVLKPKLEDKYQNVLKPKLEDKYQNVLKPKLEDKYQNVLKPKLEDKYQNVLKPKLEDKYQNVLKPKLEDKYQNVLKPKLEDKYKPKLEDKYQTILKPKLKNKYQTILKPKLNVKYQKVLKWELKCKYIDEIKLKLKQRLQSDFKDKSVYHQYMFL